MIELIDGDRFRAPVKPGVQLKEGDGVIVRYKPTGEAYEAVLLKQDVDSAVLWINNAPIGSCSEDWEVL